MQSTNSKRHRGSEASVFELVYDPLDGEEKVWKCVCQLCHLLLRLCPHPPVFHRQGSPVGPVFAGDGDAHKAGGDELQRALKPLVLKSKSPRKSLSAADFGEMGLSIASFSAASSTSSQLNEDEWLRALLCRSHESVPWPPTALPVRNEEMRPQSAAELHCRSVHASSHGCCDDGSRKSLVTVFAPCTLAAWCTSFCCCLFGGGICAARVCNARLRAVDTPAAGTTRRGPQQV